jgi:hypothetical protein
MAGISCMIAEIIRARCALPRMVSRLESAYIYTYEIPLAELTPWGKII